MILLDIQNVDIQHLILSYIDLQHSTLKCQEGSAGGYMDLSGARTCSACPGKVWLGQLTVPP